MKKIMLAGLLLFTFTATVSAQTSEAPAFGSFSESYVKLIHDAALSKDTALSNRLLRNYEAQYKQLTTADQKSNADELAAVYYEYGYAMMLAGDKAQAMTYMEKCAQAAQLN